MDQNLFIGSGTRLLFSQHQLDQFEGLWDIELPWFEEPNKRRGGWSGVSRLELGEHAFFIKRQENHNTRTLLHPFQGEPTFKREFDNVCRFQTQQIPAIEAVYYGERYQDGKHQAILISRALDDYQTFEEWYLQQLNAETGTSLPEPLTATPSGREMFDRVAALFVQMHGQKIAHWCPYPTHIFVRPDGSDARFIDLEKARYQFSSLARRRKDLGCFIRRSHYMTRTDLEYFVAQYFSQANDLACAPRLGHELQRQINKLNVK